MMIHKGLLTHDGVAGSTASKVIDLGFNGDFDVKNRAWNTVFVALGGYSSQASAVTATVKTYDVPDYKPGVALSASSGSKLYAHDGKIYVCGTARTAAQNTGWAAVATYMTEATEAAIQTEVNTNGASLGTLTVSVANAKVGGAFGIPMPRGVKRLMSVVLANASNQTVTAGITDMVDTDCVPGVDWKYFKAETKGVGQPGLAEKEAELIGKMADVESRVATLENA